MSKGKLIRFAAIGAAVLVVVLVSLYTGDKKGMLVHVADTRNLTGLNLYFANLYNTNRLLFTLEAVGVTALMGLVLGWVMDLVVGLIGLDLSRHEGKE